MSLPGYDAWLEGPYQRMYAQEPPGWVQDLLGLEFWFEGERVQVEGCEPWDDADEDGMYGGVDLVVRALGTGRTINMSEGDVQDALASQQDHRDENAPEETATTRRSTMTRLLTILAASAALIGLGAAPAAARPHRPHCKAGYVRKHVRRHHKCVRRATVRRTTPSAPAPASAPAVRFGTKVDPSFTQDPANPLVVTYLYNADATATVGGVVTDLAATNQLPAGVLNFYSQTTPGGSEGLFCSINVGGAVSAGHCPISYAQTGTYDVTTQYVPDAGSAVTETDVEVVSPYSTTTALRLTQVECGTGVVPYAGPFCEYRMQTVATDQMGNDVTPPTTTLAATPNCSSATSCVTVGGTIPTRDCTVFVSTGWVYSPDCGWAFGNNAWDAASWTLGVSYGGSPSRTPSSGSQTAAS